MHALQEKMHACMHAFWLSCTPHFCPLQLVTAAVSTPTQPNTNLGALTLPHHQIDFWLPIFTVVVMFFSAEGNL